MEIYYSLITKYLVAAVSDDQLAGPLGHLYHFLRHCPGHLQSVLEEMAAARHLHLFRFLPICPLHRAPSEQTHSSTCTVQTICGLYSNSLSPPRSKVQQCHWFVGVFRIVPSQEAHATLTRRNTHIELYPVHPRKSRAIPWARQSSLWGAVH